MLLGKEENNKSKLEEEVVDTTEESVDKKPRRKRRKKVIPLATLDSQLRPKSKIKSEVKKEPSVPEKEVDFPEGTRIIDAAYAIKMLRDTNYRFRNICENVAYLGQGKQKYFVLEMTSWMVTKDGILFVPVRLADFTLLESWKRLKGKAPEGFVAFQRR
jgi:hypothetical protein